ncbi:MAG: phosphotransferase family protein [Actinobacteria bacterium]|nr:phosphotransferase family protein [Actinomycetota bacterium]
MDRTAGAVNDFDSRAVSSIDDASPDDVDRTDPPGLNLARVAEWFDRAGPGLAAGPLRATLIAGGRSNLTYALTDGMKRWVLRRPPLGHVLATAHDMGREYRVITALADSAVPVPVTYGLCEDAGVIGAPFYVMDHVDGVAYRRADELDALGADRTCAIALRMIDTLIVLHEVDPAAVGLTGFGHPEGFLARQVRRWGQQLDASRSREVPGIDELRAALAVDPPDHGYASIVHGDFRLDNLLFDRDDQVAAVLDWEMATIADPLTDVALFVVYQRLADLADSTVITDVGHAAGYPSGATLLTHYERGSGRDLDDMDFHIGLACFKLAVILEGIHYRFVHGQTVGPGFSEIGQAVPPLVAEGLAALKKR